tara:strand:+ start:322 stop:1410 length:1089 start_codon:yes stop_codon:yes gene_type:complete
MRKLRQVFILCLALISTLVLACNTSDSTLVPATALPPTSVPETPAPTIPTYSIGGVILNSSNDWLLGGKVWLSPSGQSAQTSTDDGVYQIMGVPDGEYLVSVAPECVAHGCYEPAYVTVAGADVLDFHMAPIPAAVLPNGPRLARSVVEGAILLEDIEFPADNLVILGPIDMQAGDSSELVLAAPPCLRCEDLITVDAPVTWSVAPGIGVKIDPETGVLDVSPAASTDFSYTVTADVGEGEYSLSVDVDVYSQEDNPLAGVWSETGENGVNTLLFTSSGEFAVTINPYGNYQDYWGTYTFDLATGDLVLTADGANQVAPEGVGIGTFEIGADGALTLTGHCLGAWDTNEQSLVEGCGHVLER